MSIDKERPGYDGESLPSREFVTAALRVVTQSDPDQTTYLVRGTNILAMDCDPDEFARDQGIDRGEIHVKKAGQIRTYLSMIPVNPDLCVRR